MSWLLIAGLDSFEEVVEEVFELVVLFLLFDGEKALSVSLLILLFFPLKFIFPLFFSFPFKFICCNLIIFCWRAKAVCNMKGFIFEYCMNNNGFIWVFILDKSHIGKIKGEKGWGGNIWGFILLNDSWLVFWFVFASIFLSSVLMSSFWDLSWEFHIPFLKKSDSLKELLFFVFESFWSCKLLISLSLKKSSFFTFLFGDNISSILLKSLLFFFSELNKLLIPLNCFSLELIEPSSS